MAQGTYRRKAGRGPGGGPDHEPGAGRRRRPGGAAADGSRRRNHLEPEPRSSYGPRQDDVKALCWQVKDHWKRECGAGARSGAERAWDGLGEGRGAHDGFHQGPRAADRGGHVPARPSDGCPGDRSRREGRRRRPGRSAVLRLSGGAGGAPARRRGHQRRSAGGPGCPRRPHRGRGYGRRLLLRPRGLRRRRPVPPDHPRHAVRRQAQAGRRRHGREPAGAARAGEGSARAPGAAGVQRLPLRRRLAHPLAHALDPGRTGGGTRGSSRRRRSRRPRRRHCSAPERGG